MPLIGTTIRARSGYIEINLPIWVEGSEPLINCWINSLLLQRFIRLSPSSVKKEREAINQSTDSNFPASPLGLHSFQVSFHFNLQAFITRLGQQPKIRIRCLPSLQASGIQSSREECPDDRIARNHYKQIAFIYRYADVSIVKPNLERQSTEFATTDHSFSISMHAVTYIKMTSRCSCQSQIK